MTVMAEKKHKRPGSGETSRIKRNRRIVTPVKCYGCGERGQGSIYILEDLDGGKARGNVIMI